MAYLVTSNEATISLRAYKALSVFHTTPDPLQSHTREGAVNRVNKVVADVECTSMLQCIPKMNSVGELFALEIGNGSAV